MAIYHLRVKFVQRSAGRSAVAAAAYRSGTEIYDIREDVTHDYTKKQNIEHSEILLPDHLPQTLMNRETLWNTIETSIKHPRGQPAFEVEMALPRELSSAQCAQLARQYANDMFVSQGLPVDLNIHRTPASDGGEHPHVHLLISTRRFNPDGSLGKAARDLQDAPVLLKKIYALEKEGKIDEALLASKGTNLANWRAEWANYANQYLEDNGSESRIDHRTLAAQGVAREATPNIGIAIYDRAKSFIGHLSERIERFKAVGFRNSMREQMNKIQVRRPDLTAEFIANARQYAKDLYREFHQGKEDLERER